MQMELSFGEYMLIIRRRKNMTLEEVAQLLGVSVNTLSHWEQGKSQPRVATHRMVLFSTFYGV